MESRWAVGGRNSICRAWSDFCPPTGSGYEGLPGYTRVLVLVPATLDTYHSVGPCDLRKLSRNLTYGRLTERPDWGCRGLASIR